MKNDNTCTLACASLCDIRMQSAAPHCTTEIHTVRAEQVNRKINQSQVTSMSKKFYDDDTYIIHVPTHVRTYMHTCTQIINTYVRMYNYRYKVRYGKFHKKFKHRNYNTLRCQIQSTYDRNTITIYYDRT